MPASAWESLGLQDPDSFRVDPPVTPAGPLKDDRTLFAKANDWMIDAGNAAASLAGAGVSFVSPDGGAAKSIADFIKEGEGNQSDYRQKLRAELGQLIEDAKAKGDTGTLAWLQHNLSNPITELLPQAVGNFGPFAAAGKVAGGLGAARAAAGGATAAEAATAGTSAALGATSTLGGVVGAGGVRQGYYEEIQKATDEQLLKESPEYAKLRETMYEQDAKKTLGGQMNPRLAAGMGIGGTVGVISGRLGAEQALFGKNPGFARTVGAEVGGEVVEGATQQGAQNFAVQGQMPSKPLMDDVLLQGVQEAVIAAPGGIVAGAMHRPKAPEEQVKDIVDAPDLQSAVEATRQAIAGLGVNPPAGSRVIDPALMTAADTQQSAGAMTDDALVTAQSRFDQEAAAAQQMMREQAMNRIQAPTQPTMSSLGPQIDQRRQEAGVANAAEDQVSREAGIDQMRAEQVQGALQAPIPQGQTTDLATGQTQEPIQGPMQAAFARLQEQRNAGARPVRPDVGQAVQPAVQESVAGNSNDAAAVELPGRDTGGGGLRVSSGQSADAVQNTGQIAADRVPAGQSANAIDTLNSSLANQRKQRGEDSTQPAVTAVDPELLPTMRRPLKEGGATLSKHEFETVKKFADLFGKKVELFRHNDPTSSDKFDGAVLDTSDTIYLNADARDAHHLVVVGHEVGHQLKKDAPDLYKQLETRLKANLSDGNLANFARYYGKTDKELYAQLQSAEGRGAIVEEFISDLIGNRSAEYRTMLDIFGAAKGSKDAGMIYKVAQFLVDFIDGLMARINRSKFVTDTMVKDLDKVRREVRAALKEYAVRQNVEVGPKVPAEKAPATVAKPVVEPEAKPTPQEVFAERLKAFKEKKVAAKSKPNESKPTVVPTGEAPADTKPVDEVAHEAATSPKNNLPTPTEKQKEAGNYAKGHTRIAGLDISIENPAGSKRRPEWKALKDHYGYFKRSIAFDAPDNVDVFVKPGTPSDFAGKVYVIDQISPKTGKFDEHKVMLGYDSKAEANDAYHRNYQNGWKGMASITAMPQEKFRDWLRSDAPSKGPVDKGAVMRTRAKAFDVRPKMSAPRKMDALKKSASRQTDTPAFKEWFKQSTVVNKDGTPKVMYHGTAQDITEFKPKQAGAIFVADKPGFAKDFSNYSEEWMTNRLAPTKAQEKAAVARAREILTESGDTSKYSVADIKGGGAEYAYRAALADLLPSRANIMPLYVSAQNPFDYENKAHVDALTKALSADAKLADKIGRGFWGVIESPPVQKAIKGLGHDGFNVFEGGHKNLAVYESSQLKSAIGNTGKFDPANPDIRKSGQRARWDVDEPSKMDDFIRTMQDKHVDLKRVTQAIEEQVGKIEDKFNPYQAEELYHGRSAKQTTDFLQGDLKKLLTDMRLRKISVEDIGKFLHARHAEERNKRMAAINPNDPDMQDGGSGMSTKDAKAYLSAMSPEQRKAYDAIATRVDAINKGTQDLLVSSGLEKQSTIDAWNGAYKNYVPLMRDEVAETVGSGTGQGFSVRGSASKRAMGSKKDVIDILANVAMQRERAIIRAEKNRVAQALWGLAAKAENKDIWLAVSPSDDPVKLQSDLVKMGMNPIDAAGVAKEPQQRYVDPKTGMVQWRVNPMLRSASNVVAMRVDGEERYVIMNERSDRAKAIATSIKNLDADQLGAVLSVSAKISRFFASINTQYNPMFGVVNAVRDVQAAALNLSATPLAGKQKEVISQTMSALKGIYADLRAQRAGGAASSKWAALFEEFQKEGGQTGYRDMFANSADRGKGLESELRKISEGKAKATGRAVFDWLTDYNDSMENAVRLATYKTAKDNGLSNQQAASVAKNLMNFNRKGSVATQAGALYAFFNASMQGTARIAETMFDMKGGDVKTIRLNKNGKKILYGGLLFGSAQALMLAAAGFDDDEIPEFIRERNLIIPTGGKKYVTIPMPLGLHVIPNFGRVTTEFALSGGKKPGERLVSMFAVLADAFNPIGNSGVSIQTIAPTAVDPLVALAENRDFTGRPISRPDFSSLNPQPGHTRAKDTASFIGKGMSYALNLVTGGTDYKPGAFSPTPDQIDYLLGQLTGGVGREAMKAQQTLSAGYTGEDLPPHKVPLLGRFYGDAGVPSAQSSKFYQHVTELNGHKSEIDGRIKAGKPVGDYMRENPEFALIPLATSTQRQISDLKKMKKMLADNGNNKAAKMIEDQITMAMRTLNDRYKAIEARQ